MRVAKSARMKLRTSAILLAVAATAQTARAFGTLSATSCPLPSTAVRNDANAPVPPLASIETATGQSYTFRWPSWWDCTTPGQTCTLTIRDNGTDIARGVLTVSAWGRYKFSLTPYRGLSRVSFPVAEDNV